MSVAILGATGFVGGTLARQLKADLLLNSKTIGEIEGKHFAEIYCAAAPGAKWLANKEPDKDTAAIDSIAQHLSKTTADHFYLVSTVDVYPIPREVNEQTPLDATTGQAYGRNRLRLEQIARELFPSVTILRLPGLFGKGLRKNVIFDFLTNNQVEKIHSEGVFQFYNLEHLTDDLKKARSLGIDLLNVSTEPVSVGELSKSAFGRDFNNKTEITPARYDFRSIHDSQWNGRDGYLYLRDQVLSEMRDFVQAEKASPT